MKKKLISIFMCISLVICFSSGVFAAGGIESFKQVKTYDHLFKDTPENSWYFRYVKACYEYNIVVGMTDDEYSPESQLSVCQAIVVASRIHSIYTTGKNDLEDQVPASDEAWYTPYINYAVSNKLIGKNDFSDYERAVTRAETVHIFSNVLPDSEYSLLDGHKSVPGMNKLSKYYGEVLKFYNYGIVDGMDDAGNFYPDSNLTRAQGATIFARILFPSLRVGFNTYKDYSYTHEGSTITLSVPTAHVEGVEYGKTFIETTNENICVFVDALSEEVFSQLSITEMFTIEGILDFYKTDFLIAEDFEFVSCVPTAFKYGSTDAYCLKSILLKGETTVYQYTIVFTHGTTFFEFTFSGTSDIGTLPYMVNSLSVMGNTASIVL